MKFIKARYQGGRRALCTTACNCKYLLHSDRRDKKLGEQKKQFEQINFILDIDNYNYFSLYF